MFSWSYHFKLDYSEPAIITQPGGCHCPPHVYDPVRPTKLTRLVRLYDLASDPEESNDISDDYPELVESLLSKLSQYNQTQVEPNYPPVDPLSFPELQGDFFKPWFG